MHCIHRGTENPEGLKFCNQCGPPLKSMGRCAKSGVDNAPGARFCEECGGGLERGDPSYESRYRSVRATARQSGPALLSPR